MTNIEKYPNTKDALEAFHQYHYCGGSKPFAEWTAMKYEEPHVPTLLEAAEQIVKVYFTENHEYGIVEDFRKAIIHERKNQKPVRNCDRYRTKEEDWSVFTKMCESSNCVKCRFYNPDNVSCRFNWLYSEAEKEEAK